METKTIWRVVGNTDNTEGRGKSYTIAFCELEATAIKKARGMGVQGTNAPVEPVTIKKFEGDARWLGPIDIEPPTNKEKQYQSYLDTVRATKKKAASLGLTKEEIQLLSVGEKHK